MASSDAKPFPQKNVAYRVTFPIFDNTGALVTGAAGLDSEVSKDGGTFADCTNEATEIATASGIYYLDLTASEMNADTVAVIVKTSTTDAKTTPMIFYPEEAGDIRVNVAQVGGTTQTAGDLAAMITAVDDYVDSEVAAIKAKTDNLPSDPADASDIAAAFSSLNTKVDTIDDFLDTEIAAIKAKTDNLPASPANEATLTTIAGYIDTEVSAIKAKTDQLTFGTANRVDAQVYGVETAAITAGSIATDAIGAAEIAADAITEIQNGLATAAALDTVDNFLDTEIAAIKAVTDAIGATGTGLTAIPWNAAWDAEVQSEVQDAIEVNNLDHLVKSAVDTNFATTVHLDSVIGQLADNGTTATFDRTTDSLEALQAEHDATQVKVDTVDDFLDTEIAAIKAKTDNLPASPANEATLTTIAGYLDTEVAAILADTNELQTDWTNGGRLDLLVDAIKAKTDNLPADPADASDIAASFSTVNSTLSTIAGYLDTEVAAIKAKTDNLPADPADASDIAASFSSISSTLTTIASYIDTEVAAILADTNELQTDLTNGGRLDLLIDAIKAKTDSLTFTVAGQVDSNIQYVNDVAVTGTGASGDEWGPA